MFDLIPVPAEMMDVDDGVISAAELQEAVAEHDPGAPRTSIYSLNVAANSKH